MMDAPAAAVENLTALAAGGCQATCFATGSGNPIGHLLMPTVKITANERTALSMPDHLDINLSGAFAALQSFDEAALLIGEVLARVAGGASTAAERLGFLESNISRFGKSV
jgi:altronate dehydratase large subunit